jgi:threonine dehydrogenase-like Zn-dependent dehydrogenase
MKAISLQANWEPRVGHNSNQNSLDSHLENMACGIWRNPKLVMVDRSTPECGSHDVIIDVKSCGICGSDIHCIESDADDYVIFSGPASFPCTLGHEFAGRVVEVGTEVRKVQVGELVTAEGMMYCGSCEVCRRGHVNQCRNLRMVGFSHAGAFAEYMVIHERHCWTIAGVAERLGDEQAACELASLVEPVGCAQNGMFIVGPGLSSNSHVAVFGCGPIGLGAIALARAHGVASITAFDMTAGRLSLAIQMGADHAHNISSMSPQDAAEAMREASSGWGPDMVVEAAGAALQTMPIIESVIAPGGTIVYLGRTGERAPVMLDILVSKAARIVGARGHAGYGIFSDIISMLEHDRINLQPMITHKTGLSDYENAFERSRTREDGKILLVQP